MTTKEEDAGMVMLFSTINMDAMLTMSSPQPITEPLYNPIDERLELLKEKQKNRKLNFLITEMELYAHSMQQKALVDGEKITENILTQLEEKDDPKFADLDTYDSEEMKKTAQKNARDACRTERARTSKFDKKSGIRPIEVEIVDLEGESSPKNVNCYDKPSMLRGTLKNYQLKGMNWLANLYGQGLNGILADEMGIDKTVQCIAFLCHMAERFGVWGPFLVVAPTSTLYKWKIDIEQFAPDLNVRIYCGDSADLKDLRESCTRKDLHTRGAAINIMITSYEYSASDFKYLSRMPWQVMIVDEAPALESSRSMRWKLLHKFNCRNRLLLFGSTIQKSMAELWALFHFIMPTLFDSHEEFNEWFSKEESDAKNRPEIEKKNLPRLHKILKPFMLRRYRKDVVKSNKKEILVLCPLASRQNEFYAELKQRVKVDELIKYSITPETAYKDNITFKCKLMNWITELRQVCNHPDLFDSRDLRYPFFLIIDDYSIPTLIAEEGVTFGYTPAKRQVLRSLSVFSPNDIYQSLNQRQITIDGRVYGQTDGLFSFSSLANLSPNEINLLAQDGNWLFAMQHAKATLNRYALYRHRDKYWLGYHESMDVSSDEISGEISGVIFGEISAVIYDEISDESEIATPSNYGSVQAKDMLHICPNGSTLNHMKRSSLLWNDLLFTNSSWVPGGPFMAHTDVTVHFIPETHQHRLQRHKHHVYKRNQWVTVELDGKTMEVYTLRLPLEVEHEERPSEIHHGVATSILKCLYMAQPKVVVVRIPSPFAALGHRQAECPDKANLLATLIDATGPLAEWMFVQAPDKHKLVTDSGKLNKLDSLLKKLKEKDHRVLIFSHVTEMIDVLEQLMRYRDHAYMRLDGSKRVPENHYKARRGVFAFLQSTRTTRTENRLFNGVDTVIFYDSDWNLTIDQQAMDKAIERGLTRRVTVYRLICKGTVEEKILLRALDKMEIQKMVMDGSDWKKEGIQDPRETASLLIDDEEVELRFLQKLKEKKPVEKASKRKHEPQPTEPLPSCSNSYKHSHISIPAPKPLGPNIPLLEDGSSGRMTVDDQLVSLIPLPMSIDPPTRAAPTVPLDVSASQDFLAPLPPPAAKGPRARGRGSRRGRPRGSRNVAPSLNYARTENACAIAAGVELFDVDRPLEMVTIEPPQAQRSRRGHGRPRARPYASRGNSPRRSRRIQEAMQMKLPPSP